MVKAPKRHGVLRKTVITVTCCYAWCDVTETLRLFPVYPRPCLYPAHDRAALFQGNTQYTLHFIMPRGSPYSSFVRPYSIRVDEFSESSIVKTAPLLHLLSHTHTDHVQGLSAKSFGYPVYCSQDAKEMLLRHEVFAERQLKEREVRSENIRTFSHLKVKPRTLEDGSIFYNGARDLLVS